jgi:streptogrisin C
MPSSTTLPRVRRALLIGAAAVTATATMAAMPNASGTHSRPDTSGAPLTTTRADGTSQSRATDARALQRDYGLSTAAASARLADQKADNLLAARLDRELGARHSGGTYINRAGRVVVTVTDAAGAHDARQSNAVVKRVAYSSRQLDRVHDSLDSYARSHRIGGVQGWYVDIPTNTVVVSTLKGARNAPTRAFLRTARSYGQRVDVTTTTTRNVDTALYGGQQVNMSNGFICSLGFNARTSAGASVFVTAGHCGEGFPTFSRNGTTLGATRSYSFPGNDYAAVNIDNPTFWQPQAAVDMYNGMARVVSGFSQAAVGSSVCKSGRTTGWTCGTIQAYNQTVNYGGGDIVSGLVRHSACVEQGDSGGSNITGNSAQGVSSGGQLYQSGSSLVCGQRVGQPNVSYYQPIGEALSANGLTLLTQ